MSWRVKTFEGKPTVAIAMEFVILGQLDGREWTDWRDYEEHRVWGDFFIVGKEGKPNVAKVQKLNEALGWDGSLSVIVGSQPPDVTVQITVNEDAYNGRVSYRADWIEAGDYVPTSGASTDEVKALDMRFGSLLRAAAGGSKKPPMKAPAPAAKKPEPKEPFNPATIGPNDIPF